MLAIWSPKTKSEPGLALATEADFVPVLQNLLAGARTSIDLLAFSFAVGGAVGPLDYRGLPFKIMDQLKALKKARGPKFRVRVFLEGRRDTAARNRVTGAHLEKAGIDVRYGSTHAKGCAVDGRYLLIGSSNLTGQSLTKNYETNLLIDRPAVAKQFVRYFDHYWAGGAHGGVTLNAPLLADGAFLPVLLDRIARARTRVAFSIYFFRQADVEAALIAAHARGVAVTGLVHNHRSFGMDDVRRTRATFARLREAGLDDVHLASPTRFTHSKYLVADDRRALIGTGNWLDRDVTTHPQLYVALDHARLGRTLTKHLRTQIALLRK